VREAGKYRPALRSEAAKYGRGMGSKYRRPDNVFWEWE